LHNRVGAVAGSEKTLPVVEQRSSASSVDPVESHGKWAQDIQDVRGHQVTTQSSGDPELKIAKLYDMLAADAGDSCEDVRQLLTRRRTVFVIGPDKRIKLTLAYPMTDRRNFDEIIRVLDSIQLTSQHKVATPANWKQGDMSSSLERSQTKRQLQSFLASRQ